MEVTEDLKKFLNSEFGIKLIINAKWYGKDIFKYGKKSYRVDELLENARIINPELFERLLRRK